MSGFDANSFASEIKILENKVNLLSKENNELKEKIADIEQTEVQRGVYQILSDLNAAKKNIKKLTTQLLEQESQINLMKHSQGNNSNNENFEKLYCLQFEKMKEYENQNMGLTRKVDLLTCELLNTNNVMNEKQNKLDVLVRTIEDKNNSLIELEEKIKKQLNEIYDNNTNKKDLTKKIEELERTKNTLMGDLVDINKIISDLQNENNAIKIENRELKESKESKESKEHKLNKFSSNHISRIDDNQEKYNEILNNSNEAGSCDYSFNNKMNKTSNENLVLADNLKEDKETLYDKSLKKIECLTRENEKLNLNIINLKEDHKIELMRLNLTIDELLKITNNDFNEATNYNNENEEGKRVSVIVKNIHAKINEFTVEELKKEKTAYLETIAKLKTQIESMENVNNMDNSRNYLLTENFQNNTPENFKHSINNQKDSINKANSQYTTNDTVNIHEIMEKNSNEIRERERKIEYLLQVLEEKNNLIEKLKDSDKITSNNQSFEFKEQFEFLQSQNENLLKEIEDKNSKIKKLNKDCNDQVAKYEILHAEFIELQSNENDIKIYTDEIELLKNKNKENEQTIEKMNRELNIKSNNLMRKETEVTTLKADRNNSMINRSLVDNNKSLIFENAIPNKAVGATAKDPKIEMLNNSLNEIRDLKEKLKSNNLNRSIRSRRGNSCDNNNSLNSSNNSIQLNITNSNFPRALFEQDKNQKINNINNSLNSINNSLIADGNFNLGNISKININDVNQLNENLEMENQINDNRAFFTDNKQVFFVSDYTSNNNQNLNLDNAVNQSKNNNIFNIHDNYASNSNDANKKDIPDFLNKDNYFKELNKDNLNMSNNSLVIETTVPNTNYYSNQFNSNNTLKKNFSNPNLIVMQNIEENEILQNQEDWDKIREWISDSMQVEKDKFRIKKIFKAKQDGFDYESFYNKSKGKSPSLLILKNNHKKIIGGFTTIEWKKPENTIDFVEDKSNSSFLFSLNLGKKYEIKPHAIAICHSLNSCPVFGLNDLEIVENADKNYNYFSNIGTSYKYEGDINDFYGEMKYLVEDYEVYEIINY